MKVNIHNTWVEGTPEEVHKLLNIKSVSIVKREIKSETTKKKKKYKFIPWTEEEDDFIFNNYTMATSELVRVPLLQRHSYNAIVFRKSAVKNSWTKSVGKYLSAKIKNKESAKSVESAGSMPF